MGDASFISNIKKSGNYSLKGVKYLLKNYADLALACFGGFLCTRKGAQLNIFGDYDTLAGMFIYTTGTILPKLKFLRMEEEDDASDFRTSRNLLGGLSIMLFGNEPGESSYFPHILNELLGSASVIGSMGTEYYRRKEKKKPSRKGNA